MGTGCPNCKTLENTTREAVEELGIEATIIKEQNMDRILAYGIPRTPGLVIDEKVVMSGRLPSAAEIKELLIKR